MSTKNPDEVVANVNRAMQEVPELVIGELVGYADLILQASEPQVPWKTMHHEETGTVSRSMTIPTPSRSYMTRPTPPISMRM